MHFVNDLNEIQRDKTTKRGRKRRVKVMTQVRLELALIEVSILSISLIAQSLVDKDEVAEWPGPPAWGRLLTPWPAYGAKLNDPESMP
jgi:hypothetical protein